MSEKQPMSLTIFLILFSGVLLNAVAQLFLKAGTNSLGVIYEPGSELLKTVIRVVFEPYIMAGLLCYVFSVGIWIVALSKVEVSIAYPMLSIGYVVNAIAAWYLFGEIITIQKMIGIFTIIIGVCIVARA
jgi:multidrug transporter EmrE-like cation transporter